MSSEPARYDAIADWYIEFTKDWDSEPLALLPDDLRGLRVLDLACGYGQASRYLAQRGARVSGLDISAALLSGHGSWKPTSPSGSATSAATPPPPTGGTVWPRRRAVQHGAHGHRRPGGHPLHRRRGARPGWVVQLLGVPPALSGRARGIVVRASEPPEHGYAWEGRWSTDGKGIRDRAGVNHRMLSTYLNAVLRAGLVLEELAERETSVPVTLIARCERQG